MSYHISIAASEETITVRVNQTWFTIVPRTRINPATVFTMADELLCAKFRYHHTAGLTRGDVVVVEDERELYLLLFGLVVNRRVRSAA